MYGSDAGFVTWATERGHATVITAPQLAREAALARASDYIQYSYVASFCPGNDPDTIPEVEYATYNAALIELAKPGFFSKTYTPGEAKVLTEVRGIKWTVVGDSSSANAFRPTSTLIDTMLGPFLCLPPKKGIFVAAVGGRRCNG